MNCFKSVGASPGKSVVLPGKLAASTRNCRTIIFFNYLNVYEPRILGYVLASGLAYLFVLWLRIIKDGSDVNTAYRGLRWEL